MKTLDREDWLKLVLWAAGDKVLSPVQLQKTLFLLQKKASSLLSGSFYNFQPYDYGPFDAEIYSDAEQLGKDGLVSIDTPPWQRWREYSLTPEGYRSAGETANQLPQGASDYLKRLVEWVRGQDFETLLRYIYNEYPDFRKNSVFQG